MDLTPFLEYGIGVVCMAVLVWSLGQHFTIARDAQNVIQNNTRALTELIVLVRAQSEILQSLAVRVGHLEVLESLRKRE